MLDVLVAELGLQRPRIVPRIGQRIAAAVPQHVRVHRERHFSARRLPNLLGRRTMSAKISQGLPIVSARPTRSAPICSKGAAGAAAVLAVTLSAMCPLHHLAG